MCILRLVWQVTSLVQVRVKSSEGGAVSTTIGSSYSFNMTAPRPGVKPTAQWQHVATLHVQCAPRTPEVHLATV